MSYILIVEDNPRWQDQIVEFLDEEEYTSIRASTLEEAIDALNKFSISLAIVDINLTDVVGNRDGEKLTKDLENVPYIILSGTIPADSTILTDKAYAFFTKQEFNDRIDEFLDKVAEICQDS